MAKLLELTDQEIIDIANPLWEDLIRTSNNKDYGGFTKNFSKKIYRTQHLRLVLLDKTQNVVEITTGQNDANL